MKKRKANIPLSIQFRNDILESQKRIRYQSEFDRLQGVKRLTALQPDVKTRMKELQHLARQSLKTTTHIVFILQNFNLLQYMGTWKVTKNENDFYNTHMGN